MANYYYYYSSQPINDNGEAGIGLILIFLFGVVNSWVSQYCGGWGNLLLAIGLTIITMTVFGLIYKFFLVKYRKAQKRYEAEQAKLAKEKKKS